jgi:ATP-dependent 26S proteasome regulatory subunit
MYALRERRVHVTQEDFEMAVAKVCASTCLPLQSVAVEHGLSLCSHSS